MFHDILQNLIETHLLTYGAVCFRIAGFFLCMPFIKHAAVPARARVALILHAGLVVMWGLGMPTGSPPSTVPTVIAMLGAQLLLGLALGLMIRMVLEAARGMGQLVSQSIGLSFATFIEPGSGEATQVIDRLVWAIVLLLFVGTDTHLLLFAAFLRSFTVLPPNQVPDLLSLDLLSLVRSASRFFDLALRLAAPSLAAGFMVYTVLAILARVAPQMNLFAIGFALTIPAGIFALWLGAPYTTGVMMEHLQGLVAPMQAFMSSGAAGTP